MSNEPEQIRHSYHGDVPEPPPGLAEKLMNRFRIERRFSYHAALHHARLIAEHLSEPPASPLPTSDTGEVAATDSEVPADE